ncbi:MAG: hypothetical protein JJE51_01735 [Thermoanaerobaculia bacterium]|nr:hypothetical protein [Thermoanaerobaculia bacterium]
MGEHAFTADFIDLRTRAEYCDLCGEAEEAERLRNVSMEIAREVDLTCYAYQLMWRNRHRDAIEILERNATEHPTSWNVYDSLGEAYELNAQTDLAVANYMLAFELAPCESDRRRIETRIELLSTKGAVS